MQSIQRHIEVQYMNRGFPKQAKLAVADISPDQVGHFLFIQSTCPGNPWHLVQGRRRADVRVEPAAGCRDQVHRNRKPV